MYDCILHLPLCHYGSSQRVKVWTERLREWLSMQVVRPLVNDVDTFHEVGLLCHH